MKDMLMSDTGDLILIEDTSMENKIKLSFNFSKTNPIQLSFSFKENIERAPQKGIRLSFLFANSNKKYKEKTIIEDKVLNQLLSISLKTPVNSLSHDLSFGNELELYKHCQLRETKNIKLIEQYIDKSFKKILSDFSVSAEYSKNRQINEASQMITIRIETSEKTFLKDVKL